MKSLLFKIIGIVLGVILAWAVKAAFFPERGSLVSSAVSAVSSKETEGRKWLMLPIQVPAEGQEGQLVISILNTIALGPEEYQQQICDEIGFISYSTLRFQGQEKMIETMGNSDFFSKGYLSIYKMAKAVTSPVS